jgi:hypothetical protein
VKIPSVGAMYRWANNFVSGVQGQKQDFLQVSRQSDGEIISWIDGDGFLQGNFALSVPEEDADPASVWLVDDFVSMNGNSATAPIGALQWIPGLGSGCTAVPITSAAPNLGAVALVPANGSGKQSLGVTLTPTVSEDESTVVAQGFLLTLNTGWEATFVFRWPQFSVAALTKNTFTQNRLYLGFGFDDSLGSTFTYGRPSKFIGLRYDTDTASPSIADTTYHFECYQNNLNGVNTQGKTGGVFNTGIAPDNNWHRFTMRSIVQGQILFSIDGGTETMIAMGMDSTKGSLLEITSFGPPTANPVSFFNSQLAYASSPVWGTNLVVSGSAFPTNNGPWNLAEFPSAGTDFNAYTPSVLSGSVFSGGGPGVVQETGNANLKFSWYNSFSPVIVFGNDSQANPPASSLLVDYFSFVYSPRLALDFNATANPTLPRYFPGQI